MRGRVDTPALSSSALQTRNSPVACILGCPIFLWWLEFTFSMDLHI